MSKARQLADLGNVYDDGALSSRNMVVNGDMKISQRGTSATGVTGQAYLWHSSPSEIFSYLRGGRVPQVLLVRHTIVVIDFKVLLMHWEHGQLLRKRMDQAALLIV